LIAWSIEHAFSIKEIKRVIVSTDSKEIANVAKNYGAEVPFIRPAELSEDTSPEWNAWRHALNYLYESEGKFPETFISIPTTAPLRKSIDIENCLNEYKNNNNIDAVITVSDSHRNPYFNMVRINKDGMAEIINSLNSSIYRRQDAPIIYDMTTVCYVVNSNFIMTHNSLFEGRVKAIRIPPERAIDIDTLLDFEIAEHIMTLRGVE